MLHLTLQNRQQPRLGVTHPAVAVSRGAVAEERRGAGEAVFRILFEYADPLGTQLGWRALPAFCRVPRRAGTVPRLKAVPEETPRLLFGRGLQLLPVLEDLF